MGRIATSITAVEAPTEAGLLERLGDVFCLVGLQLMGAQERGIRQHCFQGGGRESLPAKG